MMRIGCAGGHGSAGCKVLPSGHGVVGSASRCELLVTLPCSAQPYPTRPSAACIGVPRQYAVPESGRSLPGQQLFSPV